MPAERFFPLKQNYAGTCGFVGGFLLMMALDVALG